VAGSYLISFRQSFLASRVYFPRGRVDASRLILVRQGFLWMYRPYYYCYRLFLISIHWTIYSIFSSQSLALKPHRADLADTLRKGRLIVSGSLCSNSQISCMSISAMRSFRPSSRYLRPDVFSTFLGPSSFSARIKSALGGVCFRISIKS
jgi:hypothetical protein